MRFYGFCVLGLAVVLILMPMFSGAAMKGEEGVIQEEAAAFSPQLSQEKQDVLTAKVDDWEQEARLLPPVETETLEKVSFTTERNFQIKNASTGEKKKVAAEEFVLGAVCSEMPATFHLEALKAQAVSARTWAYYQQQWQEEHPAENLNGADFQADPDHWKGYVTKEQAQERFGEQFPDWWEKLTQAVEETEGQVLCWEGEPIAAAYHAISPGQTEDARYVWGSALPYLQPAPSRGDELAPGYESVVTVTAKELKKMLGDAGATLPEKEENWLEILSRSPSGFVLTIQAGDQTFTGLEFRQMLGLRSSSFTIDHQEGSFIFTVHGYGHGVGLSQYGADFMARQGSSYQEILAHYYSGAELCQLK